MPSMEARTDPTVPASSASSASRRRAGSQPSIRTASPTFTGSSPAGNRSGPGGGPPGGSAGVVPAGGGVPARRVAGAPTIRPTPDVAVPMAPATLRARPSASGGSSTLTTSSNAATAGASSCDGRSSSHPARSWSNSAPTGASMAPRSKSSSSPATSSSTPDRPDVRLAGSNPAIASSAAPNMPVELGDERGRQQVGEDAVQLPDGVGDHSSGVDRRGESVPQRLHGGERGDVDLAHRFQLGDQLGDQRPDGFRQRDLGQHGLGGGPDAPHRLHDLGRRGTEVEPVDEVGGAVEGVLEADQDVDRRRDHIVGGAGDVVDGITDLIDGPSTSSRAPPMAARTSASAAPCPVGQVGHAELVRQAGDRLADRDRRVGQLGDLEGGILERRAYRGPHGAHRVVGEQAAERGDGHVDGRRDRLDDGRAEAALEQADTLRE